MLLNLLTSNVSHELLTPIRGVIFIAQQLFEALSAEQDKQKASLIIDTSQLLHSQVQMLLDRSLMENSRFSP
jgi:signal transduction histidine kinase